MNDRTSEPKTDDGSGGCPYCDAMCVICMKVFNKSSRAKWFSFTIHTKRGSSTYYFCSEKCIKVYMEEHQDKDGQWIIL